MIVQRLAAGCPDATVDQRFDRAHGRAPNEHDKAADASYQALMQRYKKLKHAKRRLLRGASADGAATPPLGGGSFSGSSPAGARPSGGSSVPPSPLLQSQDPRQPRGAGAAGKGGLGPAAKHAAAARWPRAPRERTTQRPSRCVPGAGGAVCAAVRRKVLRNVLAGAAAVREPASARKEARVRAVLLVVDDEGVAARE